VTDKPPLSLALGRYAQLPQRSADVWQGGIVRFPFWVENPDSPATPIRPSGAIWVSLRSGRVHLGLAREGTTATPELAIEVLLEFAKKESRLGEGRPGALHVRGVELRNALDALLTRTRTPVVAVDGLPAVDEALRSLETSQAGDEPHPGMLDTPGVGVDRLRAFATAAERFYLARPWQHLVNEDLIVIETPQAPKGMACVSVLGNGGQEFGLGFFESRKAFARLLNMSDPRAMTRAFGVTFGPVDQFPFADVDAWEDHALPVAGPLAYPLAADIRRGGVVRRPSAKALNHIEALLRALADSTEEDYDSGRWQREVDTFDGRLTVTLTLPDVLEAEEGHRRNLPMLRSRRGAERAMAQVSRLLEQHTLGSLDEANALLNDARVQGLLDGPAEDAAGRPLTALEQAQELVYGADEAVGRRRIVLAKRALALSPDCADAYLTLGESASTAEEAKRLFQLAVDAGERTIGANAFEALTGQFWGHLETRPYMRARLALAQALVESGQAGEGIDHLRGLLRLNPNDNQGVRYILLPLLLEEQLNGEAETLLGEYADDASATWAYGRALSLFRSGGDSEDARAALHDALRVNAHVPSYLLNPDEMPWRDAPYIALGGEDEASQTADALLEAFEMTEGALVWLAEQAMGPPSGPRSRPRRRARRPSA